MDAQTNKSRVTIAFEITKEQGFHIIFPIEAPLLRRDSEQPILGNGSLAQSS